VTTLSRRLLFSAALLILAVLPASAFGQASVLRSAFMSGGGLASAGSISIRAGFGESVATVSGGGTTNVIRAGVWLPHAPTPTAVGDFPPQVIDVNGLGQNYPNPFNPRTVIPFSLAKPGEHVRLTIYSVAGRHVRTLVDGPLPAGPHAIVWNGTDGNQRAVASGVYLYLLEAPGFRDHRKLVLVR